MKELKFVPVSEYENPRGTETDNTKYIVKMLPKKNKVQDIFISVLVAEL